MIRVSNVLRGIMQLHTADMLDLQSFPPPLLIDPIGRTDWRQSVSVWKESAKVLKFAHGIERIQRIDLSEHRGQRCTTSKSLHTFIDCNSFKPFCINSWISLSSWTSLCSLNASLVRRLAYSLKLYAANWLPCRNNWRYCSWNGISRVLFHRCCLQVYILLMRSTTSMMLVAVQELRIKDRLYLPRTLPAGPSRVRLLKRPTWCDCRVLLWESRGPKRIFPNNWRW